MTDETLEPEPANLPAKSDGKFKPGALWAGNKDGRPKGIKNRITVQRLLTEERLRDRLNLNAEDILEKALHMALHEGNDRVMRVLLDKLLATPKNTEDGDAKDNNVTVIVRNLTAPNQPVATVSPGKVRVIAAEQTPIDGELVK